MDVLSNSTSVGGCYAQGITRSGTINIAYEFMLALWIIHCRDRILKCRYKLQTSMRSGTAETLSAGTSIIVLIMWPIQSY